MRPSTFVVTDPRDFDGNTFEVAERALNQVLAVARILSACLEGADVMARNAEMDRNLFYSDDPKAAEWETSPQGRKLSALAASMVEAEKTLGLLVKAAAFDPRKAR